MLILSLVVAALVLSGCTEEPEPEGAPTPRPSPSPASPTDADDRVDPRDASIALERVADGFDMPLLVTHGGDGSGRLYVVEQTGQIKVLEDGDVRDEVFLDVSSKIVAGGEQGLLGLAFDPAYASNGRFYINYTNTNGDTVVARYRARDGVAEAGSEQVLLQFDQPYANHNGGHLAFGPDGNLYISSGDGGSGGDPHDNGQSLGTLLGKLLRIDVSGGDYQAPDDNPFVDRDGARPEIWDYGLRNPWRFSFDRETGELWIADVGQNEWEEVNHEPEGEGGRNYGWSIMEGPECYEAESCDQEGLVLPVTSYPTDRGCAVTGGYVYRGSDVPDLVGGYLYADYCAGTIWILDADRPRRDPAVALDTGHRISSFGEDEDGEVYVVDHAGSVLRVASRS